MAIPRSLKAIESAKAQAIIEKFTKNGQGYWDGPVGYGDFIFPRSGGLYLIRESFGGFEIGKVSM